MKAVVHGAVAGLAGTALMTAAMECLWRRLPRDQRYPLPPREIIERTLQHSDGAEASEQPRRRATMAAHFAYGAATAIPFALFSKSRRPLVGAFYGVTVWAASYLGWVPALRILKPAWQHPARRNLLMIVAHLIWGAAMAVALRQMEQAARVPSRQSDPHR